MIEDILDAREKTVEYLRDELIGPRYGDEEILTDPPNKRYTMGILFPRDSNSDSVLDEEEADSTGNTGSGGEAGQDMEDQGDDPIVMANQYLPSSLGISFFLRNDPGIKLQVDLGRYQKIEKNERKENETSSRRQTQWKRKPFNTGNSGEVIILYPDAGNKITNKKLFNEAARLNAIWRDVKGGWLVTVTIINEIEKMGRGIDPDDCLFQVGFKCEPVNDGEIPEYPRNRLLTNDIEEQALDILYRDKLTYGVGHGCSVDWEESENRTAISIQTELIPSETIPPIDFKLDEIYGDFEETLSLYNLANSETDPTSIIQKLNAFVDGYETWIEEQPKVNQDIPDEQTGAKEELIDLMKEASSRMRTGINVLENDPVVFESFCLANRAMLMQYVHSLDTYSGTRKKRGESSYRTPRLIDYKDHTWRPFQLAFILLTISSVAYPESPEREIVDLIWFPTGGGKTEAYLGVSAFLMFYRRMVHGDKGKGTALIMRYTLRLLTTQQFQRAATMICACEMIRRQDETKFGSEPYSIGLWIGGEPTSTFQKAFDEYNKLLISIEPENPFMLDLCPWCGTEIVPERKKENEEYYGIVSSQESFYLYCPEESCPFHEILPVRVIDDQLYREPPTLILATIDKFARLAWVGEARVFFGEGYRRPPELIIQDELHLIAGPLGTIAGIYETAIDMLASWQGTPPKVLASTATIRRATEQCMGLYSRAVNLFPPSGLNIADSYFANYDKESPGRLYIGIMGQGHTASTSMIRTSAALIQAPIELELEGDALDAYWTLVAYHNSLRELGKSLTFGKDDIPARIMVIASDQENLRALNEDNIIQLTSSKKGGELSGILERLNLRFSDDQALSFMVCTNMFSVGVDVQRLGLMLVNGQPKSTAEYIQSTSRVGRGVPGLVVCLLSPTKPRDRSHYERFKAYHSTLYRSVEPTSVTPFSTPARNRALHAALVILVRHGLGYYENSDARHFRKDMENLDKIISFINSRIDKVDPRESSDAYKYIQRLIEEWDAKAQEPTRLDYRSNTIAKNTLLVSAGFGRTDGWDTLNSMRNVDRSSVIKIKTGRGI